MDNKKFEKLIDLIINEAKSQNAGIIMTSLNSKDLMSGFELITI